MTIKPIANPQTIADDIFNLAAEKCKVFKNQHGEPYLVYQDGQKNVVVFFNETEKIQQFLRKRYYTAYNRTVKSAEVKTAYETLLSCAECCEKETPVFTRVKQDNVTIYYDLADSEGYIVTSGVTGTLIVPENSTRTFFFHRDLTMCAQARPLLHENEYTILDCVNDFFNIPDEQKILFAVYICSAFLSEISHPILIIEGEKGAGKSTALRYISKIINPVKKDLLVLPHDITNLVTVLSNNYFTAFDNVGIVTPDVANVLCQAVTGGSLSKRKLYSDNSEVCINIRRLVALNGISMQISQSDLLDRAIMIKLNRIDSTNRATEGELNEKFNHYLPNILGDIFSIIGKALEIYRKVKLTDYPRMADFCKYGYAIAEAICEGYGNLFIEQYTNNQKIATESVVGENPLLECVKYIYENEGYWKGTMSTLLLKMQQTLPEIYIGKSIPTGFPKSASSLSRKLNNHQYDFKILGINIQIGRDTDRYVVIGDESNKKSIQNNIVDDIDDNDDNFEINF